MSEVEREREKRAALPSEKKQKIEFPIVTEKKNKKISSKFIIMLDQYSTNRDQPIV